MIDGHDHDRETANHVEAGEPVGARIGCREIDAAHSADSDRRSERLLVVAALYPLYGWVGRVKARRRWWLSYL